jgi:hypothetical protein
MNWTIEYDENGHFVRVVIAGKFKPESIATMADELFAQSFWHPNMNVLFDHNKLDFGVTEVDTWRDLSDLHVKNNNRFGTGKVAFLMKSLPDFARGRQYELLAQKKVNSKLRIFIDENEALNWVKE